MRIGTATDIVASNDSDWCKELMRCLADGGGWGVPRTGLWYEKRGDTLVLTDVMPWDEAIVRSAEELLGLQEEDHRLIQAKFAEAGFTVTVEPETMFDKGE